MESKEGFDYTIPDFSVIIYRGRSEFVSSRFFSTMVYSAAVTDGFIRDTEEVNARISPTRIVIGSSAQQTLTGATPPFSERCSSLLKRVRFGYGSLINLFSTTLSNSRVQSLTVSAKRKPVHSFQYYIL